MAEGRVSERWDHTSQILCLLANVNRHRKRKPSPFKPADFHPFRRKQSKGIPWTKENLPAIKAALVGAGAVVRKVKAAKPKKG